MPLTLDDRGEIQEHDELPARPPDAEHVLAHVATERRSELEFVLGEANHVAHLVHEEADDLAGIRRDEQDPRAPRAAVALRDRDGAGDR